MTENRIPTALAPTVELATPKVEKFIETKVKFLDNARVTRFFVGEPATCDVRSILDRSQTWIEGNWGVDIEMERLDVRDLDMFDHDVMMMDEVIVSPDCSGNKLQVSLWIHARVMRH